MKILVLNSDRRNFAVVNLPVFDEGKGVREYLEEMGFDTDNCWWMEMEADAPVSVEFHELTKDQFGFEVHHSYEARLNERVMSTEGRRALVASLIDRMDEVRVKTARWSRCKDAPVTTFPLLGAAGVGVSVSILSCGKLYRLQACSLQKTDSNTVFINCRDPKVDDNILTFPIDLVAHESLQKLIEVLGE